MQLVNPDGTRLGATLVPGRSDRWIVIAGATAVPHRYYRPLSEWLSERLGANVLSFDYRGIDASKPDSLVGFQADYRQWATDLATAIDYAADRGPTVVVGHSFGGHAFGMTDAHDRTLGLYTFATGAGWHGHMVPTEAIKAWVLWNLVGPPLTRWFGYLPMSKLGMGEDLPLGVYRDWKRWCAHADYFFADPEAEFVHRFDEVRVPVVGVNSTDDAWAHPASAWAFLKHYPTYEPRPVSPADNGLEAIGHMAYVRPKCGALWKPLERWISDRFDADARGTPALAQASGGAGW